MAGIPFHDWDSQIRFLRGNLNRGRDNFLVIHGPEGHRKSTTGMNYALTLNPNFNPDTDIIWDTEGLLNLIEREVANPRPAQERVWFVDEGANLFYNREWATVENRGATKIQRKSRIVGGTWIVCLPDFEALDIYLREHRVFQRVYCPPYFDGDGATIGPSKVFWRSEWFSLKEGRVMHHWKYVYPLAVKRMDGNPAWERYERTKVADVMDEVSKLRSAMKKKTGRSDD